MSLSNVIASFVLHDEWVSAKKRQRDGRQQRNDDTFIDIFTMPCAFIRNESEWDNLRKVGW